MNHIAGMEVVHAKADVDEDLPEEVVRERLALLLLDRVREVTILAVLHHDANGLFSNERVEIADYEMTVDLCHYLDFEHCFKSSLFG